MKRILCQTIVDLFARLGDRLGLIARGAVPKDVLGERELYEYDTDIAWPLGLASKTGQVGDPLQLFHASRLAQFLANPDADVGAEDVDLQMGAALDVPQHAQYVRLAKLPPALREKYRGPDAREAIVVLRNRLGEQEVRWMDSDPTNAHQVSRVLDGDEVAELVAAGVLRPLD